MIKFIKANKNFIILIAFIITGILLFALLSKQIGALVVFLGSFISTINKKEDETANIIKENIEDIDNQIVASKEKQVVLEQDIKESKERVVNLEKVLEEVKKEEPKLDVNEMLYLLNN